MFKFILLILIINIQKIQTNKILFECTYDETDSCRLQSFDGMKQMIIDASIDISYYDKPNRPLSDVSSILKPTKNGYFCKLPYRKQSNLNDIYFCYKYSSNSSKCQTTNGFEDECQQGKYQLLLLENIQYRQFITPIINSTKNSIQLTYYYYLTRNETVSLSTYYFNEQGQKIFIGQIDQIHTNFNRWNFVQHYFNTNSKSFQIIYEIYRHDMSNPSQPFYIAFDQITLTEPIHRETFSTDEAKDDLRFFIPKLADQDTSGSTEPSMSDATISFTIKESSIQPEEASNGPPTETIPSPQTTPTATTADSTTTDNNNYSNYIDSIAPNEATSSTITTTTSTITSTTDKNGTITEAPLKYGLEVVLGLAIGLGVTAALGIIGVIGLTIYIIKIKKRIKTSVRPTKHTKKTPSKTSKDIPLKKQQPDHHPGRHRHHDHKKTKRTKENIV
ncbi:unnamed protein product [Rotaria sp. Silwood1]|nr:unnamed protein product [Rotaria sp. Silwood1]